MIGFAGALRRSEIVAFDAGDVLAPGEGLVITLRKSKTDEEGAGAKIGLPYGSTPCSTIPSRSGRARTSGSYKFRICRSG